MIGALTWALGKLGLSLADGKTLGPIAGFLGACVAAVGLLTYIAHSLTAAGYDKAVAECAATSAQAEAATQDHQAALREASREVIIKHTTQIAHVAAAAADEHREVSHEIETNPVPADCGLSPVSLRIWNRALGPGSAAGLPGGSAAAGGNRFGGSDAPGSAVWRSPLAATQPDGFKEDLSGLARLRASTLGSGQALPADTSHRADIGARSTH